MSRTPLARLPSALVDVGLAAVFVVWVALVATQIEPAAGDRAVDGLAYGSIVAAGGTLALRRRRPLATVVAVTTAVAVYLARGYPGGPVYLALFLALYSLAGAVDRRVAFAVGAASSATLVAVGLIAETGPGLFHLVFVGWTAAAVFLGDAVRSRRQHLAGLEERANHLQQSREEEARRRVAEERLRIARDLHDSVAHSMAARRIPETFELVGLRERSGDRFGRYSFGMKQRLGIAAALMGDPELLVLDEPTNGLDPAGIKEMRRLIIDLAEGKRTVLVSSHILGEVEQICDWLIVIDGGVLVYEGRARGFLARATEVVALAPESPRDLDRLARLVQAEGHTAERDGRELLVDVDGGADPRAIAVALNRAAILDGIVLAELHVRRPTLESEYLSVVQGARR